MEARLKMKKMDIAERLRGRGDGRTRLSLSGLLTSLPEVSIVVAATIRAQPLELRPSRSPVRGKGGHTPGLVSAVLYVTMACCWGDYPWCT